MKQRRFICGWMLVLIVLFGSFSLLLTAEAANTSTPKRNKPKTPALPAVQAVNLPDFDASAGILDAAGKISGMDLLRLQAKIKEIREKRGVGVGIVILPSIGGKQPRPVAREYLNNSGYNDAPHGGTLLLLAMQSHNWYFVTDKKMQQVLLDKFATNKIGDKLVPAMRDGQVAAACEAYLDIVDQYTEHYLQTGSAYSDADPPPDDRLKLAALGVLTALLAAFAAKYYLRLSMSNILPATDADAYIQNGSFALERVSDEFRYMEVSRVTRSRSSDDSSSDSDSSSSDDGGGGGGGTW